MKPVVKGNNLALEAADIAGVGHWLELQYDESLDKWVLQNPAKGITPASGVPVGTVEYFAMPTPPAGYLKADGAAVGRQTYPELFAAIGVTFGEGDRETTFNLPDLIGRFAQGSSSPEKKIGAGLPNAEGTVLTDYCWIRGSSGVFDATSPVTRDIGTMTRQNYNSVIDFDLSRSSPIYGASDSVQPPALTLLPCIKAFDAASNPGLIDITGLANEVASHKHVTETFNDGTNWYRKWSDGWLEQGGKIIPAGGMGGLTVINLNVASDVEIFNWCMLAEISDSTATAGGYTQTNKTSVNFYKGWAGTGATMKWVAYGMQS